MKSVSFIFLFFVSILSAQNPGGFQISNNSNMVFDFGRELNPVAEDIKGSKYNVDVFQPASISIIPNQTIHVRYNIYDDEIEFKNEGKIFNLVKTNDIEVILISSNTIYKYTNYIDDSGTENFGYLMFLLKGDRVSFFAKESITLVQRKPAVNSYTSDEPAYFRKNKEDYYIQINSTIKLLPKKKKDFLALFGEKSTALEAFMKTNKLSNSSKEDLIKIATFVNEN
jgi:hypothetical protein